MSGYRNGLWPNQREALGAIAFGAFYGLELGSLGHLYAWEALEPEDIARWLNAADEVTAEARAIAA